MFICAFLYSLYIQELFYSNSSFYTVLLCTHLPQEKDVNRRSYSSSSNRKFQFNFSPEATAEAINRNQFSFSTIVENFPSVQFYMRKQYGCSVSLGSESRASSREINSYQISISIEILLLPLHLPFAIEPRLRRT